MHGIRDGLIGARTPALALVTAFLLGALVIVLTDFESLGGLGADPLGALRGAIAGVLEGYPVMLAGAIGDPGRILTAFQTGNPEDIAAALRPISETLVSATPFIFAGLGLVVSFHAGLFNLGVEGQFLIGGLGAAITAALVAGTLAPPLALAIAVLGGIIAGGAYGFVPGLLKARTGAHEVITTLMLNGIAPNLAYLVAGWIVLSAPADAIPAVPPLIDLRTIRVDYGFVVALAMAVAVSLLMSRSTLGFELRTAGHSMRAAAAAGIRPGRTTVLAMTLSGALVGMGSAFYALGPALGTGGGPPWDFGYVAIALALLAGRRPGGVVIAAVLYGALTTGAKSMVVATGIPLALLTVIVAFAIMLVAAPGLTRWIWRLRPPQPVAVTENSGSIADASTSIPRPGPAGTGPRPPADRGS
ncbi:MAG TPA: ABC transporter permease [Candidatus Limnocylindrales bacterium]|nr:ABC transporter permease [Candidatus Limnocylindrales bacterium]